MHNCHLLSGTTPENHQGKCKQQPKLPYISGFTKVHHYIAYNLDATHTLRCQCWTIIVGGESGYFALSGCQVPLSRGNKDPDCPRRKEVLIPKTTEVLSNPSKSNSRKYLQITLVKVVCKSGRIHENVMHNISQSICLTQYVTGGEYKPRHHRGRWERRKE